MTSEQKSRFCRRSRKFAQQGECGRWIAASFLPHTAAIVDELCFVKSHAYHSGESRPGDHVFYDRFGEWPGKPSMGAWLTYGLGSETDESSRASSSMTCRDREASCGQIFYDFYWGNGFLPSKYQGVKFRGSGRPGALSVQSRRHQSTARRRRSSTIWPRSIKCTWIRLGDPEIATRIAQYEMAYRMQASVPELTDLSSEPKHVLDLYGPDVQRKGQLRLQLPDGTATGRARLPVHSADARRLGSAFATSTRSSRSNAPTPTLHPPLSSRISSSGGCWRTRSSFGAASLVARRFGRDKSGAPSNGAATTIRMRSRLDGRRRSQAGHDIWRIRRIRIQRRGRTRCHVHDLQATILHLLGIDHERFTLPLPGTRSATDGSRRVSRHP